MSYHGFCDNTKTEVQTVFIQGFLEQFLISLRNFLLFIYFLNSFQDSDTTEDCDDEINDADFHPKKQGSDQDTSDTSSDEDESPAHDDSDHSESAGSETPDVQDVVYNPLYLFGLGQWGPCLCLF